MSVDSVNPGYGSACLNDGIRYPGAQYWPGKTWISDGTATEHWAALDVQEFPPVIATAVRVVQKKGGGNPNTPGLMGLSEIEIY